MADPPKKIEPPGWNDPPMLNYSPTNPPPKTRIQNKRVMHSFDSTSNSNTAGATCLPPKAPSQPSSFSSELYTRAEDNFEKVLNKVGDNKEVEDSIKKLLEIWRSGVFPETIQTILSELSNYLIEANIAKCNELYLTLCMKSLPHMTPYFQGINSLIVILSKKS